MLDNGSIQPLGKVAIVGYEKPGTRPGRLLRMEAAGAGRSRPPEGSHSWGTQTLMATGSVSASPQSMESPQSMLWPSITSR